MNSSSGKDSNVFSIKDRLASGSFGSSIFKAVNPSLGQIAVAKKFPPNFTSDYEGYMVMLDTVRSCKNPNIVTIHGYYKATSQLWVVMEYCQAFSVHTLMEHFSRPLKETQIKTVLSHVLKGLVALHMRQIVHTRIRCKNILVTTYGVCKLAEPGAPIHHTDTGVNLEGIVGISYWTAPEILRQEEWMPASDVWSLGITVIEMAERAPPYFDTHPQRVAVVIPQAPPPTYVGSESLSKYFKSFLTACLQKDPEERVSANGLLSHKFVKKADTKGMYTMAQKYLKTRNTRSTQAEATLPLKPTTPVTPPEEEVGGSWAESDTLKWEPITEYNINNTPPLKKTASLSSSSPTAHKNNISRAPSSPAVLRSNMNTNSGTMKRPAPSTLPAPQSITESEEDARNVPSPGPVQPIPRVSNKLRYQDSTVTINSIDDYTPHYMSFYDQSEPDTLANKHDSLLRRNSLDQRGMEVAKVREELKLELVKVDSEYCRSLMEMRYRYLAEREEVCAALGSNHNTGDQLRDIWELLDKVELITMLRYLESKHQEDLRTARDMHEMERVILMQSLKVTPDMDRETEIRETLSRKEREHVASVTMLKREFGETQAHVLRVLERIQCVDNIASE